MVAVTVAFARTGFLYRRLRATNARWCWLIWLRGLRSNKTSRRYTTTGNLTNTGSKNLRRNC